MILDVLFGNDYHYEFLHKLAISRLLELPGFAKHLVGAEGVKHIKMEPDRGAFDILLEAANGKYYFELKCGSTIGPSQQKKQQAYSKQTINVVYLFLGSSSVLYRDEDVQDIATNAKRISYHEILAALKHSRIKSQAFGDLQKFADEYAEILMKYQAQILAGVNEGNKNKNYPRLYHYELYHRIRSALSDIPLVLQTVNKGGTQELLTLSYDKWENIEIGGHSIKLYYEFVNARLKIKFTMGSDHRDTDKRSDMRNMVCAACHSVFANEDKVLLSDGGRTGEYMTVCEVATDFGESYDMSQIRVVLPIVHNKMKDVAAVLQKLPSEV